MKADLETLAEFDAAVAEGSLAGGFVQSLDLRERSAALRSVPVAGALFLGCELTPSDRSHLSRSGALIFPRLPDLPFNPYRTSLYTAQELYAGVEEGYPGTPDGQIYRWLGTHKGDLAAELAFTLHDHAITESLDEELSRLAPAQCVGVMGGHGVKRGTDRYAEAAVLGKGLADAGRVVVTGGGPGAMEAANLGGACEGTRGDLDAALAALKNSPDWGDDRGGWALAALELVAAGGLGRSTVGVPTWFYGQEPPNAFATHIAKYFSNALREDRLLTLCRGGLVFLPGAAGTVQELFQAVTPNYYAEQKVTPTTLVLVGRDYWTSALPAWPLVQALATGRAMRDHLALVDNPDEALALLT